MEKDTRKKLIGLAVFFCVLAALGAVLGGANVRTEGAIQRESAQKQSQEYTPQCDGQDMRPGDSCVRTGGGGGSSMTYEEMIDQHNKEVSVVGVRDLHLLWRDVGFGFTLLFLIVAGILLLVARRERKPAAVS